MEFTAVIHVRLTEDSPEEAQALAQEIANSINNDACTTCAEVALVTGALDRRGEPS